MNLEVQEEMVFEFEGNIYTSSLVIAKELGKEHKNVIQATRKLEEQDELDGINGLNFQLVDYLDQKLEYYEIRYINRI
jgi:phage regulator Rha-like protein